jgi:hypothetical protein
VDGSDELAGAALALLEGEALAEAPLALGDPLSSTKVVVLSPPHPASTNPIRAISPAPYPFMTASS